MAATTLDRQTYTHLATLAHLIGKPALATYFKGERDRQTGGMLARQARFKAGRSRAYWRRRMGAALRMARRYRDLVKVFVSMGKSSPAEPDRWFASADHYQRKCWYWLELAWSYRQRAMRAWAVEVGRERPW